MEWDYLRYGGEGGIRTHGRVSPTLAFEASSFNRSDTSPQMPIHSSGAATARQRRLVWRLHAALSAKLLVTRCAQTKGHERGDTLSIGFVAWAEAICQFLFLQADHEQRERAPGRQDGPEQRRPCYQRCT